jgi:MFS family permease
MSDISIRLDGLVLLSALGLGAIAYALIAIASGLTAWLCSDYRKRARRIAGAAAAMTLGTVLAGLLFGFVWADSDFVTSDVDWVDWLTVPWGLLFMAGCWGLARVFIR